MAAAKEVRLAVGSPDNRRSTVWKFLVNKSDVYIHTRMFGSDSKVSLHASGLCQWSATDSWVRKVPGRRNADRHFQRWQIPWPVGNAALLVFEVRIPETELRVFDNPEDLSNVEWLPPPPAGHTASLECYLTPIAEVDPALTSTLLYPHLFSLPLADGRWFTVLHYTAPLDGRDLIPLRKEILAHCRSVGRQPDPSHRMVLFTNNGKTTRGLIEVCAIEA